MKQFLFGIQRMFYLFKFITFIILITGCNKTNPQHNMESSDSPRLQNTHLNESEEQNTSVQRETLTQTSLGLIQSFILKYPYMDLSYIDLSRSENDYLEFLNILLETDIEKNINYQNKLKKFQDILRNPKKYHAMPIQADLMPIFIAVATNKIDIVKLLLEASINDDIQINRPHACLNKELTTVVEKCSTTEKYSYTPLMCACLHDNIPMVQLLLSHEHIKVSNDIGPTILFNKIQSSAPALLLAFLCNKQNCIPHLIGHKSFKMAHTREPLCFALETENSVMMQLLLEGCYKKNKDELKRLFGKDDFVPNQHTTTNKQPINEDEYESMLFLAIESKHTKCLEVLLKYIPPITQDYDKEGNTPLIYAIRKNDLEKVQMLVQYLVMHKVDVHEKCKMGHSPLYYALKLPGDSKFKMIEALCSHSTNEHAGTAASGATSSSDCQGDCYLCKSSDALWMDPNLIDILGNLMLSYYNKGKNNVATQQFIECTFIKIIKSIDLQSSSSPNASRYNYANTNISKLILEIIQQYVSSSASNNSNARNNETNKKGSSQSLEEKVMHAILASKENVGAVAIEGRTLLSYLAELGCIELISLLEKSNSLYTDYWDMASGNTKRTPLSYAVYPSMGRNNGCPLTRKHLLTVKKLIGKKANINHTCSKKKSILSYVLDNDLTQGSG